MKGENTYMFKKACVELLEIIKYIPNEQKQLIPEELINEIKKQKDDVYVFKYDFSKTLLEQDLLSETKSLLLQIYIKYVCDNDKKIFWDRYNQLCLISANEEKRKNKY